MFIHAELRVFAGDEWPEDMYCENVSFKQTERNISGVFDPLSNNMGVSLDSQYFSRAWVGEEEGRPEPFARFGMSCFIGAVSFGLTCNGPSYWMPASTNTRQGANMI